MSQVVMKLMARKSIGKQILANPEEYFTEEIMNKLDAIAKQEFSYGTN